MICKIQNHVKTPSSNCFTHGTLEKVIKETTIYRKWVQLWNRKHSDFYISVPLPRKNHHFLAAVNINITLL